MAVGIKEVARVAGVSPATVSRVLGNGLVSEELRAQVEAAVRATGYRPNLSARRLRSQHSHTVGLIVADICNPFFTAVSRAVEDAAYKAGLRVILCNTDEDPDKEAMVLRLMEEERVTGVIFAPTRASAGRVPKDVSFPTVLIDRVVPMARHDSVVLDNFAAASELVEHLHAQGWRRVRGLFGNASTTGEERHAGYVAAMKRCALEPDAVFVSPTVAAAETEVGRWLASGDRPEAIIVSNGLLLMGVVRALRSAGLELARDIAVAGFDNEPWTELIGPGLTTIEQPVESIGRTAVQLLLQRLQNPQDPVRKVVLAGRCVVRGSTLGPASAAGPAVLSVPSGDQAAADSLELTAEQPK